jgi:signal transduction histidine kinase
MARVIASLAVAAALAVVFADGPSVPLPAAPFFLAGVLAPALVGLRVVARAPRIGWILLLGSLSVALVLLGDALSLAALAAPWPVLFLWPLALAFVFPDGRLPSPRWRPVAWFAALVGALLVLLLVGHEAFGIGDWALPVFWFCWAGLLVSLCAGAAALFARYRAGDELLRRQVGWLAYGALLVPLWLGGTSLLGVQADIVTLTLLQGWPALAVGVAVSRHGLYAIDRLVNRTLVYAALTALLVGAYAVALLVAGTLVGGSALRASLATVVAALLFLPLRDRLQRLVDRRFARRRYEAVRRVRAFVDAVHDGRAEPEDVGGVLRLALGDPGATLLFRLPETAGYADRDGRPVELPADGRERSVIGRELGVLLHAPVAPDLLRGVLAAAAVPVELARLRVELRLQPAEVSSSRARIAQAGYEERRRIERDLHDGAQQRLVTLGIVLRRLQRSLPREAQLLVPALDAAVDEVAGTIVDLRTIAAGVRPPRLDEGLAAALADLARGAAVPVEVAASEDRAPPEVEAAAYYVACEALTNAVKHAAPSRVVVQAARRDDVLRLTIADDGVGGAVPAAGSGLPGMRDRVAAHGGTLAIDSPPGAGTTIAVELPCGS